uniref:DUF8040 domain-containing protein n=1 Tax=Glycine max TaxID=3847 RepID=A0A0R0KQM1_SOYBN
MEKDMFNQLYIELVEHDLQGTKQMGVREMVIMFLNTIGHEIGNTMIQKRFQHSKETVNRHFHKVLVVCLRLAFKYIKPQDSRFYYVNPKIKNESHYHLPDFRHRHGFDNCNEVFNYYHSSLRCIIERTFGVWKNNDDHICEDQSLSLIATSSREMDLVQDSIKDQIIECMSSN